MWGFACQDPYHCSKLFRKWRGWGVFCSSAYLCQIYTCRHIVQLLSKILLLLFIAVFGSPPLFASQHPNVYVFETDENGNKQDLVLPCSIDNPPPTVNYTWFRGDQKLPGSMVNGEGSLIVPNIIEGEYASREGVDYYCIARDSIGFDVAIRSRTITVFYTCEPIFRDCINIML